MVSILASRLSIAGMLVLVPTIARAQEMVDKYVKAGEDQYSAGEYSRALANYSKAIDLWPNDATLYKCRDNAYRKLRLYYQALADYTKAIHVFSDADGYKRRGDTYFELRHYQQAVDDYTKYIDLKPDDAFVFCGSALVYGVLRQYHQAMDWYATYHQLYPNDGLSYAAAYRNRGDAYLELKRYDQAIADYGTALSFNPGDTDGYRDRIFAANAAKQNQK